MRESFSIYTKAFAHLPSYTLPGSYRKLPGYSPTDAHLTWYIYQVRCLVEWPLSIQNLLSLTGDIPMAFAVLLAVLLGIYTKQYIECKSLSMIISII